MNGNMLISPKPEYDPADFKKWNLSSNMLENGSQNVPVPYWKWDNVWIVLCLQACIWYSWPYKIGQNMSRSLTFKLQCLRGVSAGQYWSWKEWYVTNMRFWWEDTWLQPIPISLLQQAVMGDNQMTIPLRQQEIKSGRNTTQCFGDQRLWLGRRPNDQRQNTWRQCPLSCSVMWGSCVRQVMTSIKHSPIGYLYTACQITVMSKYPVTMYPMEKLKHFTHFCSCDFMFQEAMYS